VEVTLGRTQEIAIPFKGTINYRTTPESLEQSFVLLEQALAIDPDYALAHSNLGAIAILYDNDLAQAAGHMELALQKVCRWENRADRQAAVAMHEVILEQFIASFKKAPI
jgi:hypothetical protein